MQVLCLNITTLQQGAASVQFQSHRTTHKIFSFTIKIPLSFIDTATNTRRKVTNYKVSCGR